MTICKGCSISHDIYAQFCCALLCCGYIIDYQWIYGNYLSIFFMVASLTLTHCQWRNPGVQAYNWPAPSLHKIQHMWKWKCIIILGMYCTLYAESGEMNKAIILDHYFLKKNAISNQTYICKTSRIYLNYHWNRQTILLCFVWCGQLIIAVNPMGYKK